ncbi:MAG: hypothetical protein AAF824_24905 [Bacteroidota bacterium]
MAINIYQPDSGQKIAYLAEDEWELPAQLYILQNWLVDIEKKLPPGSYIADIGFQVRSDASGGGGTLSVRSLQILAKLGMELYFSEYST